MANVCDNQLRVYTENEENQKYVIDFLKKNLHAEIEGDNTEIEAYFDSKWMFPTDLMEELYKGIPDKKDIDMTCLSVEWGCRYCEFHTCDEDGWNID